ncbi:hypothetical protein [Micromonospora sp. CPCC 206061]|uniref:hypothetical protein n=1 Tax=Micromonospora sp. CPCC 206061 TaxID=3122410 RepID=UPI002FEF25B4
MQVLLSGIVGSTAYGLAGPDSDVAPQGPTGVLGRRARVVGGFDEAHIAVLPSGTT